MREKDRGAKGPVQRLVIVESYQIYQFGAVDAIPDLYPDSSINKQIK